MIKMEYKQIGMLIALILATIMLFLPGQDKKKYAFNPETLSKMIEDNSDHVDPQTLSSWIIEGRQDYSLIDIRSPKEYDAQHIKTSKNIPMAELLKKETLRTLPTDKVVVIYSNGLSHASQAWLILKTAGFDCYVLEGGLNHWNKIVMNPSAPSPGASDDEILQYKAAVAASGYFGGGGQVQAVDQPAAGGSKPATPIKRPEAKKKGGGC